MDERDMQRLKEFAQFLNEGFSNYVNAEINAGRGAPSQADYANWLKLKPPNLSRYLNMRMIPGPEAIDTIAEKLGLRAYEIWGVPPRLPRDKRLMAIARNWAKLNDKQRAELDRLAENFSEENDAVKKKGNGGNIPVLP